MSDVRGRRPQAAERDIRIPYRALPGCLDRDFLSAFSGRSARGTPRIHDVKSSDCSFCHRRRILVSAPLMESTTAFLTFTEALERAATRHAGPAVWDGGRWRSWRDCRLQADRTAGALHRRGLRAGDVLATQLPNCWELVVLHAATARLGVLMLPLHSAYGVHELQSLIDQSGASALVARDSYRGRDRVGEIIALRERCDSLQHVWRSSSGSADPDALLHDTAHLPNSAELMAEAPDVATVLPRLAQNPQAPLVLLASSGTTSQRPKLCVHSHGG